MIILLGICLGLVLLYLWLVGWWFARILMVPVLAVALGLPGIAIAAGFDAPPGVGILLALAGIVAAWFLAGSPTYYWRHRVRQILAAQQRAYEQHYAPKAPPLLPPPPVRPALPPYPARLPGPWDEWSGAD